ncbi:heavy metal translocating P-type ATPase [Humisphaera borealis]|uniref:Heavy metal translocating P-type ATPase n=1 Tax=Humisphaera borealis TaxID=2807512 RepID=A0A7M2WV94_9BACT|nr:heavy metal translocating P-type ATPase [Humisphaera borealis]
MPVPPGLILADAEAQFCCAGCQAVYQTLRACGLEAYYRLRDNADVVATPVQLAGQSFEAFDSPTYAESFVLRHPDGSCSTDLTLEGLTCAACVWLVEKLPQIAPGVVEARLSFSEATVRVTWDPSRLSLSQVAAALARIGYRPHPVRGGASAEMHRRETRRRLVLLAVSGAIMANTMMLGLALYAGDAGHMEGPFRTFFRVLSAGLGLVSLAWPGATFFRSAWMAIRLRVVNLDVPIAAALLVGGLAGLVNVILDRGEIYFDSLTVLLFLLLVGRFVQYRQQRRADDAVGLLFNLTPSTCHLLKDGRTTDVPVDAIQSGDSVEVRPGETFPADGVILAGRSMVNQALLTGESTPTAVNPGAQVYAGSQNVSSPLVVQTMRTGRDTRIGKLMRLIEDGVRDKPPIVQFADRVGAWFVVVVSVIAVIVFAVWGMKAGLEPAIDHTVALLIVTCPCVLGLATPLTIAIAIGRLSRRDILVKSGAALERLARGGRLLLDKTGTLTEGQLQLVRWTGVSGIDHADLRRKTAELERRSNHPIGRALATALLTADGDSTNPFGHGFEITDIVERNDGGISGWLSGQELRVGSPRYTAAAGIVIPPMLESAARELEQSGATAVYVSVAGQALAVAGMGDRVRVDAAKAIADLSRLGWTPQILSGDAQDVVAATAREVGIHTKVAFGQMSPEEKLARVHRRPGETGAVVMVGDGVNDAAALAAAEVGIAVQGGAEASLSAADVYIARRGLLPLVELVQTSRRTMRLIRRNLLVSLGYNLLAGSLAAAGLMSPLVAAIIMPVSSATVLTLVVLSINRAMPAPSSKEPKPWK